jgi:hypothetical protein
MEPLSIASALGNFTTSVALAAAGLCALALAVQPHPGRRRLPPAVAFAAGAALIALAADEGLELHDRVGRWLWREHGVVAPGPVNHVDDLFVIAYAAAGALALAVALPFLLRAPGLLLGIAVGGALGAGGTSLDALGVVGTWTDGVEEAFEAAGALVLAVAFGREARAAGALTLERERALPSVPDRYPQSMG